MLDTKKPKKMSKYVGFLMIVLGLILIPLGVLGLTGNNLLSRIDKTPPKITLIGNSKTKIELFSDYQDRGATANDDIDGDLTNKITTNGDVDTHRIGKYQITYEAKDEAKNKATAIREVEVLPPALNNTKGIPILMYHFFYDSAAGEKPQDSNFIDVAAFDQQIKHLKDNSYYFPTWTELNDYLDGKLFLPQKSIIITADDGSPTFFNLAYPVLAKYNVPTTSFLITSWSGDPAQYDVDRTLISFQSHSHAMHTSGCESGHGGLFQCIDYQAGHDDLTESKKILGSSDAFCYPFGDYNDHTKKLLKDTGYLLAVTTEPGIAKIGMDKLALPRVRVSGGNSLASFVSSID